MWDSESGGEAVNFFTKLGRALVTFFRSGNAEKLTQQVVDIAKWATPLLENLAALTPTRTDDQLIALNKRYVMPNLETWLKLDPKDRGPALLEAATVEAMKFFPAIDKVTIQTGIHNSLLNIRNP